MRYSILVPTLLLVACQSSSTGLRQSMAKGGSSNKAEGLAGQRPSIVLLYADDAGYADFGFQKHAAKDLASLTPHIDSIAREGLRFDAAYMSGAVCSPSRAGMLTGRRQMRFGHENNIPPGYMKGGLPLTERTFGDRLKAAGYHTGIVGKWHLGYPAAYHPNRRGFDWFHGLLQGSRSYFPYKKPSPNRVIQENGKPLPERGYVTDRFGEAASRFIEEHAESAREGKPFFLYVSFTAPHGPLQAKPKDLAKLSKIENGRRRKYAGLIKALDDNVGRILATLDRTGLAKDTLLLFTNDNGGQTLTGAVNLPLRGRKGMLYEGGIRVPLCVRWPGRIAAGSTNASPVVSLDFLPTFLELAGRPVPQELDGTSLVPLFADPTAALRGRPMYWRTGGKRGSIAIRQGPWKLLYKKRGAGPEPELYQLDEDLSERKNVAAEHPDIVKQLKAMLDAEEAKWIEPLWGYRRARGARMKRGGARPRKKR